VTFVGNIHGKHQQHCITLTWLTRHLTVM